MPLFAIDPKGRVEVFATEAEVQPKPGWVVLALVDADPDEYKRPAKTEKAEAKAEKLDARTQ